MRVGRPCIYARRPCIYARRPSDTTSIHTLLHGARCVMSLRGARRTLNLPTTRYTVTANHHPPGPAYNECCTYTYTSSHQVGLCPPPGRWWGRAGGRAGTRRSSPALPGPVRTDQLTDWVGGGGPVYGTLREAGVGGRCLVGVHRGGGTLWSVV